MPDIAGREPFDTAQPPPKPAGILGWLRTWTTTIAGIIAIAAAVAAGLGWTAEQLLQDDIREVETALHNKIEASERALDAKIEASERALDAKIENVEASLTNRIDRLDDRLDDIAVQIATLNGLIRRSLNDGAIALTPDDARRDLAGSQPGVRGE